MSGPQSCIIWCPTVGRTGTLTITFTVSSVCWLVVRGEFNHRFINTGNWSCKWSTPTSTSQVLEWRLLQKKRRSCSEMRLMLQSFGSPYIHEFHYLRISFDQKFLILFYLSFLFHSLNGHRLYSQSVAAQYMVISIHSGGGPLIKMISDYSLIRIVHIPQNTHVYLTSRYI